MYLKTENYSRGGRSSDKATGPGITESPVQVPPRCPPFTHPSPYIHPSATLYPPFSHPSPFSNPSPTLHSTFSHPSPISHASPSSRPSATLHPLATLHSATLLSSATPQPFIHPGLQQLAPCEARHPTYLRRLSSSSASPLCWCSAASTP